MGKENNLKDYLADLYQGIASKKPDASKNPQDFRAEIESIETGGGSEDLNAELTEQEELIETLKATLQNKATGIPDGYVPEGTVPDGYVPEGTVPDGYVKPEGEAYITENGSHDVSGKATAVVNVPAPEITTEETTVTPSAETQEVTPTAGAYLSKVTVNPIPSDYTKPSGTKSITENGTYDVKAFESVEVNVLTEGGDGTTTTLTMLKTVPVTGEYQFNETLVETGALVITAEEFSSEFPSINSDMLINIGSGVLLLPIYVSDMEVLVVYRYFTLSAEVVPVTEPGNEVYVKFGDEVSKDDLSSELVEVIDSGAFGAWILANTEVAV